jgi:hypothetical protein
MNVDVTYERTVSLRQVLKMVSPKLVPAPVAVVASTASRVKEWQPTRHAWLLVLRTRVDFFSNPHSE